MPEQGFLVGVFPEGTRSSDGALGTFKPGFAALVRRTELPIYPSRECAAHTWAWAGDFVLETTHRGGSRSAIRFLRRRSPRSSSAAAKPSWSMRFARESPSARRKQKPGSGKLSRSKPIGKILI